MGAAPNTLTLWTSPAAAVLDDEPLDAFPGKGAVPDGPE